jgi:hypothetical protein
MVDLDIVSKKYGCPLHMCILKHRFDLAVKLLDSTKRSLNPHITNSNGSNAMHILFANFNFGQEYSEKLAHKLINKNLDINLIDTNELSPIHVAIKK